MTVITGFFGSGKTTLLQRVLSRAECAGTAVIINEIGELPLDHLIIATPTPQMVVLGGGCVCCSARGDLVDAFASLLERRRNGEIPSFARIIVETTGIADPTSVAGSIAFEPQIAASLAIDGIVTLVDAVNGLAELESNSEAAAQLAMADKILVSKIDLIGGRGLALLRDRVRQINPYAPMVQCLNGDVAPEELFDLRSSEILAKPAAAYSSLRTRMVHAEGRDRRALTEVDAHRLCTNAAAGHRIRTRSIIYDRPIDQAGLALWISMLATFKAHQLLRVKALLNVEGQPVVVHAIQHVFHAPDYLEAWPTTDHRSRIVFVWRDVDNGDIVRTVQAFGLQLKSSDNATAVVQPAVYAEFSRLASAVRMVRMGPALPDL